MFILIYLLLALVMYWVVAEDWSMTSVRTDAVTMSQLQPENAVVEQTFTAEMDVLRQVSITPHFNAAERSGSALLSVFTGGELLAEQPVDVAGLTSDAANVIDLQTPVSDAAGQTLTLRLDPQSTGMSLWTGNTMSAGKFDVAVQTSGLTVNGEATEGSLVCSFAGYSRLQGKRWFWPGAMALLTVCIALMLVT